MQTGDPHRGEWRVRFEKCISAHFWQADGSSRRGWEWFAGLKRDDDVLTIVVRTYPEHEADVASAGDRYLGEAAREYIFDLLARGWDPHAWKLDDAPRFTIVVRLPQKAAPG